ncbi:NAD(P)/FAD-dependent oxidoreductase [Paenibacillus sp. HB172176]|uniref:NAD(P)/FAD-dependent oxidoreductase n=1 Tax=Paenibacillus sp. HB172176 TaxID=2493690 RepID=UPI00143C6A57|nr:NAD(P)/FAD-dependent oxidoreductase [Paenibacillus sp. HB172176]
MTESNKAIDLYDVTIIGGGPAGMYAAFYSGMRNMKTKLIEAKDELGGYLHMYPEKTIWDVGGIPPIRCDKLIEWLSKQARTFDPTLLFGQKMIGFARQPDGTLLLETDTGERHHTRTVIIAIGRGVAQLQKLDIEGADRFEVTNLYYTLQDLNSFRGRRVLVSGGGNTAVDWARELADVADRVTVVHRRDEFTAMERHVEEMRRVVDVRTPYAVERLHGDGDAVRQVTIRHVETGAFERLDVDAVVVNHGYNRDYGSLREWGLTIGEWGLTVNNQAETNIPGIFAAGDCSTHSSKVRLIAGAFVDAVLALNSAKRYIDPSAAPMAYVSSHNDRFRELNKQLTR